MKAFGEKLSRGEHVVIGEEDSRLYFGKSIERAWCGVVDLDKGSVPSKDSPTVLRHMAQRGFSCRIKEPKNSMKYVELWFPKKRIQEEKR